MSVDELRAEIKDEFERTRTEMKSEFENVRAEMKGEFENVRAEIRAEITTVRAEFKEDLRAAIKAEGETTRRHFDIMVEKISDSVMARAGEPLFATPANRV